MVPIEACLLPTGWKYDFEFDGHMRRLIHLRLPSEFRWRVLEDFGRGFPAFHQEFAWVQDGCLLFVTVAGFTFAEEIDNVDEQELLDRRRIPLAGIAAVGADVVGTGGIVRMRNGDTHLDWPAELIDRYHHH